MNLRGLLYKYIYKDTAEIYRAVAVSDVVDDFELKKVGECAGKLSQYGHELATHRDDVSQKITNDLRWCCDSDIDIRPNDYLKINHEGQSFELFAGEKFSYPTHCEISCRRRKEAGQC